MVEDSIAPEERKLNRLEEALWVAQAQSGDADAFVRLMNRYTKPIAYYLRRLIPQGDAALDLHQEVWMDAYRGLSSVQIPEAFRAWIYRIAHHKAARFIREEVRDQAINDPFPDSDPPDTLIDPTSELQAEAVHKGLELLPAHHREILTLHYLRDLSTHELADVLDCPPGTVKSRLYHARLALRNVIERKKL